MRMACVAFDLDATIGNFQVIGYLAHLWSIDMINATDQLNDNRPFIASASLKTTLERVKETFAAYLLRDKDILSLIIRPNIGELLGPLLEAKRTRHLKTMIIYSNTGVTYTVELAEYLLEHMFKASKLFSVKADWWHPLRTADRVVIRGEQIMHKRIETLQLLFQKGLKSKKKIPLGNILFIDDRVPRHTLIQQIPEGLTYLVPTPFEPTIPYKQKEYILFMAFAAMQEHGLFDNKEYLDSRFCHRMIKVSQTMGVMVNSLPELFGAVSEFILSVEGTPWKSDSAALRKGVREFLKQSKP
jgi:hypothetical protein